MPVPLPAGVRPAPILFQPNEVLTGGRIVGFRFDVLDREDRLVDTLDGVTGGSVDWSAYTAIKGSGTMDVSNVGQQVDWLNARIRPAMLVRGFGVETDQEYRLGVYVCAAPKERWSATGMSWAVELLDKCAVLDQDIVTNDDGDPVRYVAPVGANVIDTVAGLINGVGEATPALEPDTTLLSASMTWDLGTPVLQIVNDLLAAAGYASLWLDSEGQFRTGPYVSPVQRDPVYSAEAPFTVGNRSVLDPEWEKDRDVYSIPNRYVAVGVGDETTEAAVAVVVNDNAASPFSFQARGRWITRVETGIEATGPVELESRALMGLSQAASVSSGFTLNHRFLPDLVVNSTIRFVHPDAGEDLLCYVTKTRVPFSATDLCQSEIREAIV